MKKFFFILNILITATCFVGNYFYLTEGGLELKSFCSACFALLGIVNLVYALLSKRKNLRFHIFMAIGLILAMSGDIVLGFDFIIGASLFAAGHICYLIGHCLLMKISKPDIIISAVIFICAGLFLLFCPLLTFDTPIMQWVCFVYAFIISAMVGKAISNFIREKSFLTAVLALGSALFFFSDLMLVLDWFMGMGRISGLLCMSTYYPAECLLGFSVFVITAIDKKAQA